MIKSFFTVLLSIGLLSSCSNSGKKFFTDEACGFKIIFPAKPTSTNQSITFPFGSFSGKKFSLETTSGLNTSFSVTCIELPSNVIHSDSIRLLSQLFGITQMDYLQKIGEGGLINTWIKSINKYPGREFVWADVRGGFGYTRRVFYVKNKLYLLEVGYRLDKQHNTEISDFLDSFSLLNKALNPNPEPVPKIPAKKFTIDFPGITETRTMVLQGVKGPMYIVSEMHQSNSGKRFDESGNFAYGVNFMDLSESAVLELSEDNRRNFIYENTLNNPMVQNGGQIISNQESTINGIWCIESKALILNGQIKFTAKSFIQDKYLYQILVLSVVNKGDNPAISTFMESFRIK